MKRATLIVLTLLGPTGCTGYVHSPPGTTFPVESAKALNKGEWGVQGEIGGGGQVWGPTMFTAMARARHGVGRGFELSIQGNVVRLGLNGAITDLHRGIYSARVGFKYEVASWLAFTAGLGGGWSAGGGFVSPDFGAILAYENKYFVPFASGGGYFSKPISPNVISFVESDGDPFVGIPDPTIGWFVGAGARVPIFHEQANKTMPAFLMGFRTVGAHHDETPRSDTERRTHIYFMGTVGFEWVFN